MGIPLARQLSGRLLVAVCIAGAVGCAKAPPALTGPTPKYPVAYRPVTEAEVRDVLGRVRGRLDSAMTPRFVNKNTRREIKNIDGPVPDLIVDRGTNGQFNPVSYPMGVILSGMVETADATGDPAYAQFTAKWLQFTADYLPVFAKWPRPTAESRRADAAAAAAATAAAAAAPASSGKRPPAPPRVENPFQNLLYPDSLDSCGAITAAMVKARLAGIGPDLTDMIDRAVTYVSKRQFRLPDGTLARHRPVRESLWADDMYMGVSLLAQAGKMTGDARYYDDAAKQVLQLSKYLFVPTSRLLNHGWTTDDPEFRAKYFWGRANGWCMVAMAELLTVLPEDHPDRPAVLKQFRMLADGVASVQGGDGLWHQVLDRTDSYTETSCTAMFTYAIARGVNRGWLPASAYGPVAQAGWHGMATRVDQEGRVNGVCVGTSFASDFVYYYARPAVDDIHGYGPVLLAGSEMIRLARNPKFQSTHGSRGYGNASFGARRAPGVEADRPSEDTYEAARPSATRPATNP